ncbi:MAG: CPBP family intramembrane glutamate endopeptidase, partial [Acidobacteriota bacterium]
FWRTKTLWLPIGLHAGWNIAQVLLGTELSGFTIGATGIHLRWSAGTEIWSGGAYGLEGGVLTTLMAVVVFGMVRRVR